MRRPKKILAHMEELVYTAVQQVIEAERRNGTYLSDSAYVRKAIIKDLIDRGMITDEMVVALA